MIFVVVKFTQSHNMTAAYPSPTKLQHVKTLTPCRNCQIRVPASPSDEDQGGQVLVLRGLRASTLHKDISLRAVGASGMASAAVFAPAFTTLREFVFGVSVLQFLVLFTLACL